MWKTGATPRRMGIPSPQACVENHLLVHSPCGSTGFPKFIHRKIFDFPRGNVEKIWVLKNARFGAYREELMLEVMSRTADCSGEAGSFRLISTLRME